MTGKEVTPEQMAAYLKATAPPSASAIIDDWLKPAEARVTVSFRKSSTKDGGEGYEVDVREGATEKEAKRVMKLAAKLRQAAREALGLEPSAHYTEQLEEILK